MNTHSKKTALLLASLLFLSCFITLTTAQAATSGKHTYGGDQYDVISSSAKTPDGGYVMVGTSGSYGVAGDFWLLKTDADGNLQWNRTYGGDAGDFGLGVINSNTGGYVLVGSTYSYGAGEDDIWLIKTDAQGNMVWNRTIGGPKDDYSWIVIANQGGGYTLAGYTYSFSNGDDDVLLVQVSEEGTLHWMQTYGGVGDDRGYTVIATKDGGYLLTGYTNSTGAGDDDLWLIKTDYKGAMQWNRTYGGAGLDLGYVVTQTSDGDYVIVGGTTTYGACSTATIGPYGVMANAWLLKVDSGGNPLWHQTYGVGSSDCTWSLLGCSDGGYMLAGYTSSYSANGRVEAWLFKVDAEGKEQWSKSYGGDFDCYGWNVLQTQDGGYAFAGNTQDECGVSGDGFLYLTDSQGNVLDGSVATSEVIPESLLLIVVVAVLVVAFVGLVVTEKRRR